MSTSRLNSEQWSHLREIWSLIDTDEDGKISTHDLLTLMKSFGYHHTEEEMNAFMDDLPVCLENDRSIDFVEFLVWILKLGEKIDHEEKGSDLELEKKYEVGDQDGDAAAVMREILSTIRKNRQELESKIDAINIEDDKRIFQHIDKENKGFITFQDLVVLKNELGEEFTYDELNEIMNNEKGAGQQRLVHFEDFRKMLHSIIAWDEPDMLPCHQEFLDGKNAKRTYEIEGESSRNRRGSRSGCVIC
uniref:EF-hand domain-containing protein n=1 Tax=Guillardia theta TaxID=55529 RepID=A0A7S4PID0_GUITH|mmetsp:Transcript_51328/g.160264  ORF Transcript_51328/g.160264 Transcript_51328/m.160264 type:complete len:247 (+) Transcript_51328:43-783(+)